MTIIASAPVRGSLDRADTDVLPHFPTPACPPWCVDHVDATTQKLFGPGAWHCGQARSSAQLFTGNFRTVDGQRVPEMEPVRLQAESYTHPEAADCEAPGVYVSNLGKLSAEAAMDLATDLIRCVSELVAAEIATLRGSR